MSMQEIPIRPMWERSRASIGLVEQLEKANGPIVNPTPTGFEVVAKSKGSDPKEVFVAWFETEKEAHDLLKLLEKSENSEYICEAHLIAEEASLIMERAFEELEKLGVSIFVTQDEQLTTFKLNRRPLEFKDLDFDADVSDCDEKLKLKIFHQRVDEEELVDDIVRAIKNGED